LAVAEQVLTQLAPGLSQESLIFYRRQSAQIDLQRQPNGTAIIWVRAKVWAKDRI